MIYLASPYSHPDTVIRHHRFAEARNATAWLLKKKCWVYSPIVHCHELTTIYALPTYFTYWQQYNEDMIKRCDHLYILTLEGWNKSEGVAAEWKYARALNIPTAWLWKSHDDSYVQTRIESGSADQILPGLDQSVHAMDEALREP